ncbi:uncharacterized protein LOC105209455 isoform X1 [Zeugodacus cucurbitae]|uniref:Arginine--tRNA ligase n=1 Tax=Zeugodacus cucurbitae TaxID=28588 RepID=A0A0A1X616_ZEUCU|nr:uncharacterized protein LOC105209455 isoform X1 [Zeugodacus cucurbitae]
MFIKIVVIFAVLLLITGVKCQQNDTELITTTEETLVNNTIDESVEKKVELKNQEEPAKDVISDAVALKKQAFEKNDVENDITADYNDYKSDSSINYSNFDSYSQLSTCISSDETDCNESVSSEEEFNRCDCDD